MTDYVKRYEPKIVENNDEMNNIYTVQGEEIEKIGNCINKIKLNAYIQTMDIKHVKNWEKILNISSNDSYSLEERKTIILNVLLFKPPYTRQSLEDVLYNIWGEGNYQFEIYPNQFQIIIDVNTYNPVIYLQFTKYLRRIIPANIYLIFSIQYTYLYLNRNKTYNEMQDLTYTQLSQFENE